MKQSLIFSIHGKIIYSKQINKPTLTLKVEFQPNENTFQLRVNVYNHYVTR